jgi:hypothetical protein
MQFKYYYYMSLLALSGTPLGAWAAPPEQQAGAPEPEQRAEALNSDAAPQQRVAQAAPQATPASGTLSVATPPLTEFKFAQAAPLDQLDHLRGGTEMVNNSATLSGIVTGNTAINVNTGSNIIDGGAFANFSGVPIVVQNSGANVLIQNSTIVNLQMK